MRPLISLSLLVPINFHFPPGKKTKETFDNYHEEENAKKGHDKKEKHKKKYHDAKGAKKKHKVEKEHYDKEHEAEEGEKGAKFEESGSHEKGE